MSEPRISNSRELTGFLYTRPWFVGWGVVISVVSLFLLNYMRDYYRFHYRNRSGAQDGTELAEAFKLPPLYPSFIPFLSSAISFAWDNGAFIRRAA